LQVAAKAWKDFLSRGERKGLASPFFATACRMQAVSKEGKDMEYRYEVTSEVGYLQRVATHLLTKGYYFFVQGVVREGKDPAELDVKLLAKYDIIKTERARRWRKSLGLGNVQYVRFDRSWILLATKGRHLIREGEGANLKDVRKSPIRIGDYTIYVKQGDYLKKQSMDDAPMPDGRWRVRVLIAREPYRELCAYFLSIACHRRREALEAELSNLPYEPYAPVRKQLLKLLRLINTKRQAAGYTKLRASCLRFKREIVRAFEPALERAAGKPVTAVSEIISSDGASLVR
jgi:hypothetical protein